MSQFYVRLIVKSNFNDVIRKTISQEKNFLKFFHITPDMKDFSVMRVGYPPQNLDTTI